MNKYFRNIKRRLSWKFSMIMLSIGMKDNVSKLRKQSDKYFLEIYLNIISKVFMVLGVSINAYRLGNKSHSSVNAPVDKGSKKT